MVAFPSCLFAFVLYLRASSASDNSWNAEIPKSVVGPSGSCVVIPCKFNYPSDGRTYNEFTGIWYNDSSDIIYHKETSKIIRKFKGRTTLLGDLHHKNCTLKINSLHHSDAGSYMFRIEIKDLDKNSFRENKVSITVKDLPEQPSISVKEEVLSQRETTATCIVSHSCPSDPPRLILSHEGTLTSYSQPQDHDQWRLTSSLTFTPSREDHNEPLICSAEFSGGKKVTSSKTLKVKYPPYNVNVESKSQVKENTSVELNCSSNSNPPASFQWISLNGSVLANGPTYKLNHVSRYTEAISCTASNREGKNSSGPQRINVLYLPEIKESSCKSELLSVCVCIVDSNPPSEVKWLSPSGAFPSSSIKQNGFLTIFTLEGWLDFTDAVNCSASNSEGTTVITIPVPNHGIIYTVVAAVLVTLVIISVCAAKRHCSKRQKRSDIYANYQDYPSVNKNWGCDDRHLPCDRDEDEAIYANM